MRNCKVHIFGAILIFLFVGCASPVGGIIDNGNGSAVEGRYADNFWIVPKRSVYPVKSFFIRETDLEAFGSFDGEVLAISLEDLEIGIIEDPVFAADTIVTVPAGKNYGFATGGRKIIVVTYGTMSDQYSVHVTDSLNGNGGGNNPSNGAGGNDGSSGEGSGITIEWGT